MGRVAADIVAVVNAVVFYMEKDLELDGKKGMQRYWRDIKGHCEWRQYVQK